MIKVRGFGILIPIKSGYFFVLFIKSYLDLITRVTGPSILDLFFIGLVWRVNPIDLFIFLFLIDSPPHNFLI